MPTVTIDGTTHKVDVSDIQLEDGYAIITPDSVPDGYFTQDAVNSLVKENVNKTKRKMKEELESDPSFHKRIFNKYNVVLDDDGNPSGLKPDVDVDKVKEQVAKQVSEDYEDKLGKLNKELEARNQAVVESAIMEAASGNYREDWIKSFDGGKPLVVKHFADRIGVDEEGKPYVKDENGEKMFKGDGVMRPKDYLLDEKRFGQLMKDKRQRGSDFQNGSTPDRPGTYSQEDVKNMSDEEYAKHRKEILQATADGRVK